MADISQFKLKGVLYDVKDTIARSRTIPTGGTPGQILAKNSSTDYDAAWIDPSIVAYTVDAVSTIVRNETLMITTN